MKKAIEMFTECSEEDIEKIAHKCVAASIVAKDVENVTDYCGVFFTLVVEKAKEVVSDKEFIAEMEAEHKKFDSAVRAFIKEFFGDMDV